MRFYFRFDLQLGATSMPVLLECDGRQHFEPIEFFGGIGKFYKQQHNDFLKTRAAIANCLYMTGLDYTQYSLAAVTYHLLKAFKMHSNDSDLRMYVSDRALALYSAAADDDSLLII